MQTQRREKKIIKIHNTTLSKSRRKFTTGKKKDEKYEW